MQAIKAGKICEAVSGSLVCGKNKQLVKGVSIDSRTIEPGQLFVAIIGENHDGHSFIGEAVRKGAGAVISQRNINIQNDIPLVLVEDTTVALQQLANYYRNLFPQLGVIAVTGSAGKTTTKDMIAAVLNQKFTVKKTEGNLNNHYGLPLTLLELTGDEDFAVLEMGMSSRGEIRKLARIAEPDTGVVTNVGPAHLETLRTVANVARAKAELIEELPADGRAVLNYDDNYVQKMKHIFSGEELYYFSLEEENVDYFVDNINYDRASERLLFSVFQGEKRKKVDYYLSKPGIHNIYNALPACILGDRMGLSCQEIQDGLFNCDFSGLRMDIVDRKGYRIINDTYNANPLSMKAALDALQHSSSGRKIAVLGDMLELGPHKEEAHREIGKYTASLGIEYLVVLGDLMAYAADSARRAGMPDWRIFMADSKEEIAKILADILQKEDTILLKGSRGMEMEKVIELYVKQEDEKN